MPQQPRRPVAFQQGWRCRACRADGDGAGGAGTTPSMLRRWPWRRACWRGATRKAVSDEVAETRSRQGRETDCFVACCPSLLTVCVYVGAMGLRRMWPTWTWISESAGRTGGCKLRWEPGQNNGELLQALRNARGTGEYPSISWLKVLRVIRATRHPHLRPICGGYPPIAERKGHGS